jgi:hypothetical protein
MFLLFFEVYLATTWIIIMDYRYILTFSSIIMGYSISILGCLRHPLLLPPSGIPFALLSVDLVKGTDLEIYMCQGMTARDYAGKCSQAVMDLAE